MSICVFRSAAPSRGLTTSSSPVAYLWRGTHLPCGKFSEGTCYFLNAALAVSVSRKSRLPYDAVPVQAGRFFGTPARKRRLHPRTIRIEVNRGRRRFQNIPTQRSLTWVKVREVNSKTAPVGGLLTSKIEGNRGNLDECERRWLT